MLDPVVRMPHWFEPGVRYAGALDHIGPKVGLVGWVLDLSDVARNFEIAVMSKGQVIARAEARDARPDIGRLIGLSVDCGFHVAWRQFDIETIQSVFDRAPEAEIEIVVSDLAMALPNRSDADIIFPFTVSECMSFVFQDRGLGEDHEWVNPIIDGAHASPNQTDSMWDFVQSSGLFDMRFYLENSGIAGSHAIDGSLISHYFTHGERSGFKPNPFFDPKWYARKYLPEDACEGALRHYIEIGESKGYKPCPVFDPQWYRDTYLLNSEKILALSHFLKNKQRSEYNPNEYFDIKYYTELYSDIAGGKLDGFSHWLGWGLFEGRLGSPKFNPEYVWRRYLGNKRELNAFEKFMDIGLEFGWEPTPRPGSTIHRAAAVSSEPGALFESLDPFTLTRVDAPKVVAMYLPQFHSIPENDAWWGEGFTEWRNLMRALPRYVGHIQPRIPRDLGFYELIGSRTIRRQIDLAKHAGLHGFCYYYYNFNGRRLLEQPVETFLRETDIDFPFCILWANENWTRRWDGMEQEILIRQDYLYEDAPALVADIARHMQDRRYIRSADGRPYFFVYRVDIIPDCVQMLQRWRDLFRFEHALNPLFFLCQTFGVEDPRAFGFDGALEFPPHKLTNAAPLLNANMELLDPEFSGPIVDYRDIVQESMRTLAPSYPLIKTAFPNWDNGARRQAKAMSIANSSPKAFETWTATLLQNAERNPVFGDALVFINAWNEWCEGAYLEPDTHFGFAYLNALRRALGGNGREVRRVALIGHDAFPAGAQHLLLALGKLLKGQFGLEVTFVLLDGGALTPSYRGIAETFVASEACGEPWAGLRARLSELFHRGFRYAICNTVVTGEVSVILEALKFDFCSLVHELPTVIRSRDLVEAYANQCRFGRAVVYPNLFVKNRLDAEFGAARTDAAVVPQGLYNIPLVPEDARIRIRQALGLPQSAEIVLNIGYGDWRKGVDIFLSLAEQLVSSRPGACFVWLGDIHPDLTPWLKVDIERRGLSNLFLLPFDQDIGLYIGAADVFVSTSREDPFPSVVLEALAAGLPVVAFENTGGHADLLTEDPRLGVVAPLPDMRQSAKRIIDVLAARACETELEIDYRKSVIASRFDFTRYGAQLLKIVEPNYTTISVIVPNYNYANYLPERLSSIFGQTYPVLEILIMDDASTDDSLQVARNLAANAKRTISVRSRISNSGRPCRQWKAGLDEVRGEFVWVAEADDMSDPRFLSEAIHRLRASPDAVFAFTDSQSIDADGVSVYRSYKGYYSEYGDRSLEASGRFSGEEFLRRFLTVRNLIVNVSAVVWRTEALREVFRRLGDGAFALRCAGDWRIYVEACRLGKDILYISDTLNIHRRHSQSLTRSLDKFMHLKEIEAVQMAALEGVASEDGLRECAAAWRTKTARDWNLDPDGL